MQTRRATAGLVLGGVFLPIPARWAAAAVTGPASVSGPRVEISTPGAPAVDDETPAPAPAPHPAGRAPAMSPPPLPRLALDPLMIEGAAFYDVVGRPDLAAAYRARHAWAVASRVAGGISLGLGVLVWTTAQAVNVTFQAPFCATSSDPSCIKGTGTLWVPDVMMVGGLALLVLPALWSNDPVSFEEKERLASEAMSRGVSWNVSAAPAPGGQGGTIVLGGRF